MAEEMICVVALEGEGCVECAPSTCVSVAVIEEFVCDVLFKGCSGSVVIAFAQ